MKKKIVFKDINDYFFKMSKQIGIFRDDLGQSLCYRVAEEFGEGFIDRVILRNGIEIAITEMELNCEFELSYKMEKRNFEIMYCVGESMEFEKWKKGKKSLLKSGEMSYWINENVEQWFKYPKETRWNFISICFEESFIKSFLKLPEVELDVDTFWSMIKRNYRQFHLKILKIPEIKVIFNQILKCNYQGISRILYLESKAIEIISLFIENEVLLNKKKSSKILLKEEERKKLTKAREIIIENIIEPLTIEQLAKRIGMNTYKLKVGFKEIYGTTIFGYLRNTRMEKAKQLITTGDTNIIDIAYEVGYSNPSQFSAAFKRKYGVNPRELRVRV